MHGEINISQSDLLLYHLWVFLCVAIEKKFIAYYRLGKLMILKWDAVVFENIFLRIATFCSLTIQTLNRANIIFFENKTGLLLSEHKKTVTSLRLTQIPYILLSAIGRQGIKTVSWRIKVKYAKQ